MNAEIERLREDLDSVGMREEDCGVAEAWAAHIVASPHVHLFIQMLAVALKDKRSNVRIAAAMVLNEIALLTIIPSALLPLARALRDGNDKVFTESAFALCHAAERGQDLSMVVPVLVEFLEHPLPWKAIEPCKALAYHYLNTADYPAIFALLEYHDPFIQTIVRAAVDSFVQFAAGSYSLVRLQKIEHAFEKVLESNRKKVVGQDPEKTIARTHLQTDFARILHRIAQRKAQLARCNDGELLAGETIPKPREKGTLYRAVRYSKP